ncbi:MAG: hypothetical protein ACREFP_12295 [Acetobacteraceae bacterium]
MATLIDSAEYTANEVYEIQQTDKVEGAASGASFGGIGVSNEPHQQLANRTAFLFNQQQTDKGNIGTLQGQVAFLLGLIGPHGIYATSIAGNWNWSVPQSITGVIFCLVGGGGGGSNCQASSITQNASGPGGGSGAMCVVRVSVSAGQVYGGAVGAGGGPSGNGGDTTLYFDGTQIAVAGSGQGAYFPSVGQGSGGGGGAANVASTWDGFAMNGGVGSDGQAGSWVFAGNGAAGPFGGAGRAGAGGGLGATGYGSGGGGAYDESLTGNLCYGGRGGHGLVMIVY